MTNNRVSTKSVLVGVVTAKAVTLRTQIESDNLGKVYFVFSPKPAKFLEG